MMKVEIYSDGSSKGNPGPGGYGTVLIYRDPKGKVHRREYSEGYRNTTNNRMELLGAIRGLEMLIRPCEVSLYSDSQYLVHAFEKHWIDGWIKKGWKTSTGQPVKNVDLWQRLLEAAKIHRVDYHWVKGHAGHPENELCDRMAVKAAEGSDLKEDLGYENSYKTNNNL